MAIWNKRKVKAIRKLEMQHSRFDTAMRIPFCAVLLCLTYHLFLTYCGYSSFSDFDQWFYNFFKRNTPISCIPISISMVGPLIDFIAYAHYKSSM